ncbi:hypothetical protein D9M68_536690 [compost metagenome]
MVACNDQSGIFFQSSKRRNCCGDLNLRAFVNDHDVENRSNAATATPVCELVCLHCRSSDNGDRLSTRQTSEAVLRFLVGLAEIE